MYKLLFIIFLITFSIGLKSWGQEKLLIPDGTWYGNLAVNGGGGAVHCSANIRSIKITNDIVTIKGRDIFGIINHKFTVGKDKVVNKWLNLSNIRTKYKFNYNRMDNTITLSVNGQCIGKETFKQKDSLIAKKADLDIKSIIKFSEDICKEIGLEENKNYYDKCVLTLIKNFNTF